MTADTFVCGSRIGGVWKISRGAFSTRTCASGLGRTPERAFSALFARVRRAA